uniref:Fibronectin type-III domain-containing protein n=1 Tax=Clastoptera arizonana TaxID=38151 RepID=A0A1B6CG26_9HEMI
MLSSEESSVLMNATGVQNIAALGSHLQPYPDARCLTPKPSFGVAELVNTTSQSITLQLPLPERDEDCTNVSLATVSSTVYYGIIDADGVSECVNKRSACFKLESFERIVTISGLQAYTNYVFLVTLRNHYSELQGLEEMVSPPSVYQTAPGGKLKCSLTHKLIANLSKH